jgi:DNA-binding NarL/FixJ family response regulator
VAVIRVLLVDDHSVFRQALGFMIDRESDMEVVAQASSLAEARGAVAEGPVIDVAVVDLFLQDGDGVEIVRDVRRSNPSGAVLVLTGSRDRRDVARAVAAGAAGVLHKSVSLTEIIVAVRRLSEGSFLLPIPEIVDLVREAGQERERTAQARQALASLTPRERDVLEMLALGLNDRQIADRLTISHETVRTHMVNILSKLDVDSRLAALVFAVRHGAIKIE